MAEIGDMLNFVGNNFIWLLILGVMLIVAYMAAQQGVEAEQLKGQVREFNATLVGCSPAQVFVGVSDPNYKNQMAVPILGRVKAGGLSYSESNAFGLDSLGKGSADARFDASLNVGERVILGVWLRTACLDANIPRNNFELLLQQCSQTFLGARYLTCNR
jgi:hypothetical protein